MKPSSMDAPDSCTNTTDRTETCSSLCVVSTTQPSQSATSPDFSINYYCQLGPGQFILETYIGGVKYTVLYDTGASICFARPGLTVQSTEAQLPENTAVKSLGVRLGDNSLVSTSDCRNFSFDVKGHAHTWDYHVMQLPAGLDFIVGMDFMGQHDVILLTRSRKVLFGDSVLNYANVPAVDESHGKNGPARENSDPMDLDTLVTPLQDPIIHNLVSEPPTVPKNVDSQANCSEKSTKAKIFASVESATLDPRQKTNSKSDSEPVPPQADTCYVPTDFLADLSAVCSQNLSNDEKWRMYCRMMQNADHVSEKEKKQYAEEALWAENSASTTGTEQQQAFSFLCTVQCTKPAHDDDGRRLAVLTRLKKRVISLNIAKAIDEQIHIAEAWNVLENPIDPTPENADAWLEHQYPKDENGVSIRHQIDKTIASEKQYVADLKSGKVCPLAAQAFQTQTKFDPPPWAERLKLFLKEHAGPAKSGPRIKCPVHLREELQKFHEDLYFRLFIEPATDSESYAAVLIIRKPDKADGTPRGWRFVVDLRCRNATLRNIANQMPEASMLFDYLRDAKVISVFDVKDGYWNCPLDEESQDLVAFSSECGEWKWRCLPQGLSVAAQFFQSWLTRLYRKYSIVIGQTKIMPIIQEKRNNAIENILSIASELQSNTAAPLQIESHDMQLDIIESNHIPTKVTAVECAVLKTDVHCLFIQHSDGNFGIKQSFENKIGKLSSSEQVFKLVSYGSKTVYADSQSYAAMAAAMPLTGSTEEWSTDILCEAGLLASKRSDIPFQYADYMTGGMDEKILTRQNRLSLLPKDLGTWTADPFAAFYVDDAITRSNIGIAEARLQVLTFLRISAVERIPMNEKCNMLCKYVRFLGMINGNGLVIPCPEKIKAIVMLLRPTDVKELQGFLGSTNWFRRHIADHAKIQFPLNQLCKKDAAWDWNEACEHAWLTLKRKLMSFPVLHTFDPKRKTILYTDASKVHVGGVLCQRLDSDESDDPMVFDEQNPKKLGSLIVIAYYSRSLRGPELDYPIQHQEMLAIVACCAAFEHFLLCSFFEVRVGTDHKTLPSSYTGLSKQACDRITRWVQRICVYNMMLFYLPGIRNDVADILSRCLEAPDDAWKQMDTIDQKDFDHVPLLAMEPAYLFTMAQSKEKTSLADVLNAEPEKGGKDLHSYYVAEYPLQKIWLPHEQALMGINVVPEATKVFGEADYLMCPEFKDVYTKSLSADKSQSDIESLVAQAVDLMTGRYEKLKIDLPAKEVARIFKHASNHINFYVAGGLLYYMHPHFADVLCVPNIYDKNGVNHRQRVFEDLHTTEHTGHRGQNTTMKAIQVRFYWLSMRSEIKTMCKACFECNTSKINRQKPQGLLQPIEIPLFPAQSYNADIIGPFPESKKGNHCVLIVVDRFSKRIFLEAHSKHMTAPEMATLFVNSICYKHGRGVPLSVISDNDKLFTANFFRTLFERFGTKWNFSTARSQSTDGQAERYVAVVEEILRTRINYEQDDWEEMLCATEFVINNQNKCSLLGKTPIQIELDITPIIPSDLITDITTAKAVKKNTRGSEPQSAAEARIQELTDERIKISEHIALVQGQQKKYADKRRMAVSEFLVPGAKAFLNIPKEQMINFGLRPSRKLSPTVFGPFPIVKQQSPNSFQLDLGISVNSRVIDVFHVKYLRPATDSPYPTPGTLKVLPVSGEGDEAEWELESLLDKRTHRGKTQYLVKYKGYKLLKDCEWRPETELTKTAPALLAEFTEELKKSNSKS